MELGAGLAGVARRRLAAFAGVRVVNAAFEQWPLPAEPFDLVVAATSFHWLDPAVRLAKSAEALRPGGGLAVISTHHVAGGSAPFFRAVQRCYERWMPGTPTGLRLLAADDVPPDRDEFDASRCFERVIFRRYEQELTYSASTVKTDTRRTAAMTNCSSRLPHAGETARPSPGVRTAVTQ